MRHEQHHPPPCRRVSPDCRNGHCQGRATPLSSLMNFFLLTALGSLALCGSAVAQQEPPQGASIPADAIAALEKKVLYHPRKYAAGAIEKFTAQSGQRLDYITPQGKQTAWIMPPPEGGAPERLWIVCAGNGTLVLELAPFCRTLPFKKDAWLLVDYPGYGECAGEPSPLSLRENLKASVTAAAMQLNMDAAKLPERACVFGHSLGCAAALLAVQEFHLRSAVLCAPFTSTREMAEQQFRMPKGLPLQHLFDNRPGLTELQRCKGQAWIFHGEADNVIPVTMSRTMATEFKGTVTLQTPAGTGHNDIFSRQLKELAAAMTEARKLAPTAAR
jgi:pimeloyl-ACP methyl ester carboxylesterase